MIVGIRRDKIFQEENPGKVKEYEYNNYNDFLSNFEMKLKKYWIKFTGFCIKMAFFALKLANIVGFGWMIYQKCLICSHLTDEIDEGGKLSSIVQFRINFWSWDGWVGEQMKRNADFSTADTVISKPLFRFW